MAEVETWANIGSAIAGLMFVWAMFQQYFPRQLRMYLDGYCQKLIGLVSPYIQITFHEYTGNRLMRSDAYAAVQNYLSINSAMRAKRLKADMVNDNSQSVVLSMDDREEITDDFNGIKVWWASRKHTPKTQSFSFYPSTDERRYFKLIVHRRYRDIITSSYINHVMEEGKAIAVKKRQRKLFTNWGGHRSNQWSHVEFEHPATFDTLAMETEKKEEIKNDLIKFSKGKDYYAKIGKAWKRGFLLYGPPGTGKSTMIAAMANFLNYDVYDLELTTVKDNSELRKLLIETTSKSIIVIEDIDCSLDLTGQREPKKEKKDEHHSKEDENKKDSTSKKKVKEESNGASKVTLSGLLNFIDGIWSACGGEKIIVFTTNYVEKLDPALIRRGRMDKHIEMSYCCFEAFKVLAKNYLDIEDHQLYPTISNMLQETNITPADVAENLMPKSDEEDEETCLKNLMAAIKEKEEEARKKAEEEEANLKAEQEAKETEKEKVEEATSKEDEKENMNPTKENGTISNGAKDSSA